MKFAERQDAILQMLSVQESVMLPDFAQALGVSVETVRRDLNYLEQKRLIKKVYGGAILYNRTGSVVPLDTRAGVYSPEKVAIGHKCAEFVKDGDNVFLGPGTTVVQVARFLKTRKSLTVVTTSIYAAMEFLHTDATVYFVGGRLDTDDAATSQLVPADSAWDQLCPSKAIVSCGGISTTHGITDFGICEGMLLSRFISRANQVYVAVDNSKFGLVYPCATFPLSRATYIITGDRQKEEILSSFAQYRQRFIFVDGYAEP